MRKLETFADEDAKSEKSCCDSPSTGKESEKQNGLTHNALKKLPTASIFDKLLIARKFDKEKFLLDFSSSGGTSDYSEYSVHSTRHSTALKQEQWFPMIEKSKKTSKEILAEVAELQ